MGKHYNYQPRVRTREQNSGRIATKTRVFTIKKIEPIGEDKVKLTFEGGTTHIITNNDEEYRAHKKNFWLLAKCLAAGDKAEVVYEQSSSRIITCDLSFELRCCDESLPFNLDWKKQILTISYPDEGRTEEKELDTSIKYFDYFDRFDEYTFCEAKECGFVAEEAIYIAGRLAGLIGF